MLSETEPPDRPLTANAEHHPAPRRIGMVQMEPGMPFEHFCGVCGAWGVFGFGYNPAQGKSGAWFCREHRETGERRWKAERGG